MYLLSLYKTSTGSLFTSFLTIYYNLLIEEYLPLALPSEAKNLPANTRDVGGEDPLEKEMATHFSIIAWEIPWTEEPGRLQSMGLQRVKHNLATKQQRQKVPLISLSGF